MTRPGKVVAAPAVRRTSRPLALIVAVSLMVMALLTLGWAVWSLPGLPQPLGVAALVIFGCLAIAYVLSGVALLRRARQLPPAGEDQTAQGRRLRIGFGVIFGVEGLLIAVVSTVLGAADAMVYLQPAVALIVGLHFLPFAPLFRRSVDFYIGGWVTGWAVAGIWLISSQPAAAVLIGSVVALTTACGTAGYGLYFLRIARAIRGEHRV